MRNKYMNWTLCTSKQRFLRYKLRKFGNFPIQANFSCCHNKATRQLVCDGGYIQNKNKYLDGSKFYYESTSYLVTKATQNLGHIG